MPGGEHKEDFATGTAAALAGGFTQILAMPNTSPPLATLDVLQATRAVASQTVRCDVGLYAGASPQHVDELPALAAHAVALKIYLNDTFGPLRVEDLPTLHACFRLWPRDKMIAMHAEGQSVAVGIGLAAAYRRPVHFCHISRRDEIELLAAAKQAGLPVTCEVTPHHLFLTDQDAARLGPLGDMRPRLATQDDQDALWAHIDSTVDCIATDHAPHTLAEKASANPPPGVAGLETSLPLMLTAVQQGRLSLDRLVELMATQPPSYLRPARPARHHRRDRPRCPLHPGQRPAAHPLRLDPLRRHGCAGAGAPRDPPRPGGLRRGPAGGAGPARRRPGDLDKED